PPEAYEIPKLMVDLVFWVRKNQSKLHPVELAALAHHKLVHIHPFPDGNGRTARLFMNLILMQKGYPLVVILKNDRQKYYRALDRADRGNTLEIEKLIAQSVERSMNMYLQVIKSGTSVNEKLMPLSSLTKKSGFSEKYLNLLARSGKLEAHKEGRNWLSSHKAIETYLLTRERKHTKKRKSS
ncbi:MAG TPA: Fic family protein, partial [Bdellovibrio sp.]